MAQLVDRTKFLTIALITECCIRVHIHIFRLDEYSESLTFGVFFEGVLMKKYVTP